MHNSNQYYNWFLEIDKLKFHLEKWADNIAKECLETGFCEGSLSHLLVALSTN